MDDVKKEGTLAGDDTILIPGSSPLKAEYALLDSCSSSTPPKPHQRRLRHSAKSLLNVSLERGSNENAPPNEFSQGVYENVEALLEAMRIERQQEKLQAAQEIKTLKEKVAALENRTYENGATVSSEIITSPNDNLELAESLLETLALLEEEYNEWQHIQRKSLGTITNQNATAEAVRATPYKTPRQKLVHSVRRLQAVKSHLKDELQRKSLTSAFEQEVEFIEKQDSEKMGQVHPEIERLEKELAASTTNAESTTKELRNVIIKKEQENKIITSKLQAAKAENKKYNTNIRPEVKKNKNPCRHLEKVQRDILAKSDLVDDYHNKLEEQHLEQEQMRDEYKPEDVHYRENSLMEMHVQLINKSRQRQTSERELKDQIMTLQEQVVDLTFRLSENERERDDLKMRLAIATHSALSTRIRQERTSFQMDKKDAIIATLSKNLENARLNINYHSHQAKALGRKLACVQAAHESAVTERNESLRKQNLELALLKDTFGEFIMGA